MYKKGNFINSYTDIIPDRNCHGWKDGMIGGNGETGFITSGSPYNDVFIFQHMYFNFPSADPREIPKWLPEQLEEARNNIFNQNGDWKIWDYNENMDKVVRKRTYYYTYHPGTQLRLSINPCTYQNYKRYTNYETGEVGVNYTDQNGTWERTTFTSHTDHVTITRINQSSTGTPINITISIDDISSMCNAVNKFSDVSAMQYKKIVDNDCKLISFIGHYPVYKGSELYDGGYASVTKVIAEGLNVKCDKVIVPNTDESINVSEDAAIRIKNATAVYLITAIDRDFHITGLNETNTSEEIFSKFRDMKQYPLLDQLRDMTEQVSKKYTVDRHFQYEKALMPSAEKHSKEFNRVSFELYGDEELEEIDNKALIDIQRFTTDHINHEFMRRIYGQARYALICACKITAPRLYGMWTGDWRPRWRSIYTLDANVNIQVSAMNTGHLKEMPLGYITFFLRHTPDFMENAHMAYNMHDAIQVSVNADADRAMHVEYDSNYPFEYWNAGASWCLLPIYEYWQCYGNTQIKINDYMRFDHLQPVLSVEDGGLSDEAFTTLKASGYLDLERNILLPLLTKQANFWEQLVTPRYYMDRYGNACHDENKKELEDGEKYMLIPCYSPENHPIGYSSTLTANATMDIAAARDGLDMLCTIEHVIARPGYEYAIARWKKLKDLISDYQYDKDGALREWAMKEYQENNNHRHLSHLYVAWPAYETQNNQALAKAANVALDNRNKFNTDDATAGHGWIHKALVEARLKRGDGMVASLLKMMNGTAYYPSLMTDHDSNRRCMAYCTDTLLGTTGAVNEALIFSNTGEIEILPALPSDWTSGKIQGLMSRARVEVVELKWDCNKHYAKVILQSNRNRNKISIRCGIKWDTAIIKIGDRVSEQNGRNLNLTLSAYESVTIEFTLH